MKEKIRNLQEKLEGMKDNIFVQHAAEIRRICIDEEVTVGVGMDMWRNGSSEMISQEDYNEFKTLCKEYTLDFICEVLAL